MDGLRLFGYDLIVADPPWTFENWSEAGTKKGAPRQYAVMSLAAIKALRVNELARRDCLLLLWTTGWAMAKGYPHEVARAWGFTPQSEIVWRKIYASGRVRTGTGYRVRTMHEPILLCTAGEPAHKPFPSIFDGVAREHSRKPEEFYSMVDARAPGLGFRADLFSRTTRPGWQGWGFEHGKFDPLNSEGKT